MSKTTIEEILSLGTNVYPEDFYFECNPGWNDLLMDLTVQLEELAKKHHCRIQVSVAKQKFGYLRFCCDLFDASPVAEQEIRQIISDVELASIKICELCGSPGKLRDDKYWIQTLCDLCHTQTTTRLVKK